MGTRHKARWNLKRCILLTSMVLHGLVGVGGGSDADRGTEPSDTNNCNNHAAGRNPENRNFLIVSTMDGKVSALNLEKQGRLEWAVDAGAMHLLSSSISDLVMTRNNVPTRLIPSLDGSLFQFDSENEIIEAMPFTADTLLSSSFKLNYDSTIVGGKESATYGVEVRTGKIRYICNSNGCTNFEAEALTDTEDVLVLTRHTKTVRAVEMRTGIEKWNFSVGQHEVSLVSTMADVVPHLTAGSSRVEGDEDASIRSCPPGEEEEEEEDWFEYIRASMFSEEESALDDLDLKVIVPKGLVIALSKTEPDRVVWKYKFNTAIANAWLLENRELSEVSLFNEKMVPALMDEDFADSQQAGLAPEPLVYIGVHEKQYYVQPSVRLREEVRNTMKSALSNSVVPAMPRIRWHPYIATAPSRTPVVTRHNPLQIGFEEEVRDDKAGLTVWHDQYPFENAKRTGDSGWYLMSDTSPIQMPTPLTNGNNRTSNYSDITLSLWNWKEVIAISLLTSIVVHLFLFKFFPRRVFRTDLSTSINSQSDSERLVSLQDTPPSPAAFVSNGKPHSVSEEAPPEYISRFMTEFELKQCLGRGGFGVVFEGLNKMDDCAYAIKRITLNNSKRAREKVMREVKALAKLEHIGIVRYYQAWFENPPAGWQEKRDTIILDMSTTPTPTDAPVTSFRPGNHISTGLRLEPKLDTTKGHHKKNQQINSMLGGGDADNPLKLAGGLDHWGSNGNSESLSGFSHTEEDKKKKRGSGGFIARYGDMLDESGSYSIGTLNQRNLIDNSFSVDIDLGHSQSGSNDIVFRHSQSDSNDIVFRQSQSGSSDIVFKHSQSGSNGVHSASPKNVPFQNYNRQATESSLPEEDMNDSFNIVFEDSGCALKNSVEEPSLEASISNTHGTQCTDLGEDLSLAHSPTKRPSATGSQRPKSLAVSQSHGACLDTDNEVDPKAPKLYLYIQMQLCRQDCLKDWLNCNTLQRDRRELLDIFDQIVCAVDYIHDNGLMHRDLKPSNIFFSLDGTVKVGDFGLVTTQEEEHHTPATHTPQHTAQHTGQVGTRLYMSPEQVAGHSYNQKVDIFSLGLIFFELFYPFATQMERIKTLLEARHGGLPPRFIRELPDECVFVKSLLDTNPDRRPTTKEIQQNPLLRDFEAARQTISRVRPRTRTTSSSGSGNSLSSSH